MLVNEKLRKAAEESKRQFFELKKVQKKSCKPSKILDY
jgi:hypothetical protein